MFFLAVNFYGELFMEKFFAAVFLRRLCMAFI